MDPQTLSAILVGLIMVGMLVGTTVLVLVVVQPALTSVSNATLRMLKRLSRTLKGIEAVIDPPFNHLFVSLRRLAQIADKFPVVFKFVPDAMLETNPKSEKTQKTLTMNGGEEEVKPTPTFRDKQKSKARDKALAKTNALSAKATAKTNAANARATEEATYRIRKAAGDPVPPKPPKPPKKAKAP